MKPMSAFWLALFLPFAACGSIIFSTGGSMGEASRSLRRPQYKHATWGIHLVEVESGEVLFSYNPDTLLCPASTTKLYSVAAAMEALGAEHRFETPVHRQGVVDKEGVLQGDLILRPMGDLTLGGRASEKNTIAYGNSDHIYANDNPLTELTKPDPLAGLQELARQVREAGIKSVAGNVLVDDRLFDKTRSTGSGPRTVTPVVVNDNLVDFMISPTKAGQEGRVDWRPKSVRYAVESKVKTTAKGEAYGVKVRSPGPGLFVVQGTIPEGHPPQAEMHEVRDPNAHARTLLIDALENLGVQVHGSTLGKNPVELLPEPTSYARLPVVAKLVSAPFSEEARLILKVSHNLHASTLPLLLAVKNGKRTLRDGLRIQGQVLGGIGVKVKDISFGGAAGGSRADLTTARVTVQLLRILANRPYAQKFRRALPILGVDGTLFQAVGKDSPARGKVQAKTGTYFVHNSMNDSTVLTSKALAGYVTTKSGRELAFCIMVNNVHLGEGVSATTIGKHLGEICEFFYKAW